jgi:hypothetical protein
MATITAPRTGSLDVMPTIDTTRPRRRGRPRSHELMPNGTRVRVWQACMQAKGELQAGATRVRTFAAPGTLTVRSRGQKPALAPHSCGQAYASVRATREAQAAVELREECAPVRVDSAPCRPRPELSQKMPMCRRVGARTMRGSARVATPTQTWAPSERRAHAIHLARGAAEVVRRRQQKTGNTAAAAPPLARGERGRLALG